MRAYRIKDWDQTFENYRSREVKEMQWVLVPNRHDGTGFCELMNHPEGMAHYAAWVLILQVASRCTPRGLLVRGNGEPHTAKTLASVTRGSKKIFEQAIERLVKEIGWIEEVDLAGGPEDEGGSPELAEGGRPEAEIGSGEADQSGERKALGDSSRADGASSCNDGGMSCDDGASSCGPATSRARAGREGKGREEKSTPPTARAGEADPGKPEAGGENHPSLEKCVAYFKRMGADYTEEEVRAAFLSMEASKDSEGRWWWGKRQVGDWRAALERRMADDRMRRENNCGPGTNGAPAAKQRSGPSVWELKQQMQALDEEIAVHKANPESEYYKEHKVTPELREEFRGMQAKRKELNKKIAQAG